MTLAGRDRLRVLEQLRQVEAIKKPLPSTLELLGSDAVRLMHFGGVGSAKTWNGSLYLFSELMPDRKPGEGGHLRHYWITGPNYDLCGRAFDLILNWSYQLWGTDWRSWAVAKPTKREGDRSVIEFLWGKRVETRSWSNPQSLHGLPVVVIFADEAGQLPSDVYDLLEARAGRAEDSRIFLAGTWESVMPDSMKTYERALASDNWRVVVTPSHENFYDFPGGEDDPKLVRARQEMSPDAYAERYLAVPRVLRDLAFPAFRDEVHAEVLEWHKGPCYVGVDPPGREGVALAAQKRKGELQIFDMVTARDNDALMQAVMNKPWFHTIYRIAVDARGLGGEAWKIWQKRLGKKVWHQSVAVSEGVDNVNRLLGSYSDEGAGHRIFCGICGTESGNPHLGDQHDPQWLVRRLVIDPTTCAVLIDQLKGVRYNPSATTLSEPHDAVDSLRYLCAMEEPSLGQRRLAQSHEPIGGVKVRVGPSVWDRMLARPKSRPSTRARTGGIGQEILRQIGPRR